MTRTISQHMSRRDWLRVALTGAVTAGAAAAARGDDWPQWRGPQRDGVWRERGILTKLPASQLPLAWRAPVGGGYSGPTVSHGRVYVADRVVEPEEKERTLCFDARTGKQLWSHAYPVTYSRGVSYPDGPRASVTVQEGRAFAIGALGYAHCYEAASGKVVWAEDLGSRYPIRLIERPPFWGISGAPLIEGDLVIFHLGGKEDACLVGLDRATGKERWRALTDRGSYSAPVIVSQAGVRVLVCWTGDNVVALDPQSGQVHWTQPFPARGPVIAIATPVLHRDLLFLTSFYEGSLMLRLRNDRPAADRVWERRGQNERNTDALHSIISTPFVKTTGGRDYIYGVDSYGELRCLDAANGDRVWQNDTAVPRNRWANIHFVQHEDRTWLFNEKGELLMGAFSPAGFTELGRCKLIRPTLGQLGDRTRGGVCWSHPAFANRSIFARNDEELVCALLAAPARA